MRRILVLVLALPLLVLAPAAATPAGCTPADCGPGSTIVRSAGLLDYRPGGPAGPLLAYGLSGGKVRFRLPPGLLSADGRTFLTSAARYDARTGRPAAAVRVPTGRRIVAVAANGRHAVLQQSGSSTVLAVDGRRITLRGDWRAEAVSNDGRRLFLLQYLRNGYKVRWYDLAAGRLVPGSLRDKTEPALMDGVAWSQLGTPDGHTLLTLFLTGDGEAAVHALDLRTPHAVCVDLPGKGDFELAQHYALALSPDGRMLTAVNPALGVVVRIDLDRSTITQRASFAGVGGETGSTAAAASGDGRGVVFASGPRVWTYDVRTNTVRPVADAGRPVVAVAFRPGDRSVLAVRADRTSRMLLARS